VIFSELAVHKISIAPKSKIGHSQKFKDLTLLPRKLKNNSIFSGGLEATNGRSSVICKIKPSIELVKNHQPSTFCICLQLLMKFNDI
jgi:hypothetical protein